jgi:hypothetical protein
MRSLGCAFLSYKEGLRPSSIEVVSLETSIDTNTAGMAVFTARAGGEAPPPAYVESTVRDVSRNDRWVVANLSLAGS